MYALEIDELSKTYHNGTEALKGICLHVDEGDFFALLGPNGAGKSTTIGIMTSLVRKSAGSIKIFGVDVDKDFQRAKALLGVVPQEFNFNGFCKVNEVLTCQAGYYGLPYRESRKRIDKYLSLLGLTKQKNMLSRSLSGGMKRRMMIARAMLHEPRMLILDEPTAGVDIEVRRTMWAFLSELNHQGTTIILTTHYLEEAENLCRNIAIINHGEVIESTTMPALLRQLESERFIFYSDNQLEEPWVRDNYRVKPLAEGELDVEIGKGGTVTDLIEQLSRSGIHVNSMRNKENRLEAMFLRLTQQQEDVA